MENKLETFLKEQEIYEKFKIAFENTDEENINNIQYYFKDFNDSKSAISCGFGWNETKEGWGFWRNIDKLWRDKFN